MQLPRHPAVILILLYDKVQVEATAHRKMKGIVVTVCFLFFSLSIVHASDSFTTARPVVSIEDKMDSILAQLKHSWASLTNIDRENPIQVKEWVGNLTNHFQEYVDVYRVFSRSSCQIVCFKIFAVGN